jgi:hypothetical protein
MGHRDIDSTMVYRKRDRSSDVQARISKGSLAASAAYFVALCQGIHAPFYRPLLMLL